RGERREHERVQPRLRDRLREELFQRTRRVHRARRIDLAHRLADRGDRDAIRIVYAHEIAWIGPVRHQPARIEERTWLGCEAALAHVADDADDLGAEGAAAGADDTADRVRAAEEAFDEHAVDERFGRLQRRGIVAAYASLQQRHLQDAKVIGGDGAPLREARFAGGLSVDGQLFRRKDGAGRQHAAECGGGHAGNRAQPLQRPQLPRRNRLRTFDPLRADAEGQYVGWRVPG